MKFRQSSGAPTRKVVSSTLSGACVTVLAFASKKFGWDLDAGTAAALVLIVMAVVQYMVPPAAEDDIVPVADD